jgi:hypothetical protein
MQTQLRKLGGSVDAGGKGEHDMALQRSVNCVRAL